MALPEITVVRARLTMGKKNKHFTGRFKNQTTEGKITSISSPPTLPLHSPLIFEITIGSKETNVSRNAQLIPIWP